MGFSGVDLFISKKEKFEYFIFRYCDHLLRLEL